MRIRSLLVISACLSLLVAAASANASPRRGDWEATGAASARGSFSVRVAHQHHKRVLAIENLTIDAPITCFNAPFSPASTDTEVVTAVLALNRHGKFSAGKIKKGNGTTVSGSFKRGSFRITYRHTSTTRNVYEGGMEVCKTGKIRLVAHPGHRITVTDGIWLGATVSQEPIEFNVAAGGRALINPPADHGIQTQFAFMVQPATSGDNCAGSNNEGYGGNSNTGDAPGASFAISAAIYVDAPGTFNNNEQQFGDGPAISASFTPKGKSANGTFTNPSEGCAGPLYNWTATPEGPITQTTTPR